MLIESSVSGVVRTIFIILGVLVLLRFLGRLMMAKRAMDAERKLSESERRNREERERKMRNFGKTEVIPNNRSNSNDKFEDVDYENVDK